MSKQFLRFTFFLLIFLTLPLTVTAQVIDIPDPNLRAAVEKALGKTSGATIIVANMASLTRLEARNANISDLTGLEHATNLTILNLGHVYEGGRPINSNSLSNISLLAGLTNLTELWLGFNLIENISPLAGLINLTSLDLAGNSVSNIASVASLTKLTHLDLDGNPLSDISPVSGLANLTFLDIWGTPISDISPVADLTNLTTLGLGSNNISDISPVAGLTNLTTLALEGNNISDISPVAGLTNLTWLSFGDNRITDISAVASLTNLTELWFDVNTITDISAVASLTNLGAVFLNHNNISDISPLAANTGLGSGDTVDVQRNRLNAQSLHTHIPALLSRGVTVEFDPPAPFENVSFDINNIPEPVPPPKEVRDFFDLDPFYQQWINVEGYPVIASANVSPYAMKEAAWQIKQMIGHRTDILKALAQLRGRFIILAYNEMITDAPENRGWLPHFFHSVRGRGAGGLFTFGSEESAFGRTSLVVHELAHSIHDNALNQQIDKTFDNRLKAVYNAAMEKGLWSGTYAASNRAEYWADGADSWFDNSTFIDTNPIKTRDALKAYDPALALLFAEVFGDNDWRYTVAVTRTHLPHLRGFNPQDVRSVEYPPGMLEAYEELRNPAINERSEWVNLPPYAPSLLPHLNKSRTQGDHTYIIWVNLSGADLLLYRVHPDGTETLVRRSRPNDDLTHFNVAVGGLLLVKDSAGRNLAVFQAVEKGGRALVAPNLYLITPGLSKVSGDNQSGVSGAVLANPLVVEVRDENGLALKGISVTFTVTAGGGTLNITRAITDKNGAAQSTLTLGQNLGTNTVSVSAAEIEGTVTFNTVVETAVDIPDPNLRAAVETALGKAAGDPINPSAMARLTYLEARNANISDLTGLEGATNLKELELGREDVGDGSWQNSNSVSDLSPLVGLTQLEGLNLRHNAVKDISALAGLTHLTHLSVEENRVSDVSALIRLTNLVDLWLDGNQISDISPLAELTQVTRLGIGVNNISDISALAGLTNLTFMRMGGNNISDLSPLVANTGLESGDEVDVRWNPLSYASIHAHIPTLQSRGVKVEFDSRTHPALLKISGDNQKGAALTSLSQPFMVEAQDENGSALAGISVTFAVTTGGGTLNPTITKTNTNGRVQSTLTLGPNLGTNTVEVSAAGIKAPVTFHAISDTEAPSIAADVNSDGNVNVLDLVLIASELGNTGTNLVVDVNGDGAVNVLDLILVAGMFDSAAAAPSAQPQVTETLTAVEVQGWLTDARALEVRDPIMKRGIMMLEQLLVSLTPKETELLANYPNPFNPETWIPYRLAEDTFVTLTIYDIAGQVVRTLDVGHRIASAYESRSKAIYWDGRNDLGEQVASGVYFYTLMAGDFSATRRLVILK